MFRDIYKNSKLYRHYVKEPVHHLYLSVHYNKYGKITKYIKHKYPNGYYEYLELLDNGYLKDKLYKLSPYCKYIEKKDGNNYYLTVHRYNLVNGKFIRRSSEYIKNGMIYCEKSYKNRKLVKNIKYKNGKSIKIYKSSKEQPNIKERP